MMMSILVSSGYGANTRQPFVELELELRDDGTIQISPDEARDLASNLFQAAEASESDAFLVEFHTEKAELPLEKAAALLDMYRRWRKERRVL